MAARRGPAISERSPLRWPATAVVALVIGALVAVAVPVRSLVSTPTAVSPELGFTQVSACVVVDTRQPGAGGPFSAPETRGYDVTPPDGDFTAQGGSATGCGIPDNAQGVFLNLKTEHQSGVGRVEVYEGGGTPTGAPIVNFDPSSFKDNAGATTMLCQGPSCTNDLTVNVPGQPGSSTQVIISVLGYFTEARQRTITVNGGGTDTENGQALLNALAAIPTTGPDTPTGTNPWLIELEPGTYDLGTRTTGLTLPANVNLEGAKPPVGTAAIVCDCINTIVVAESTDIRHLSIINQGNGAAVVVPTSGWLDLIGSHLNSAAFRATLEVFERADVVDSVIYNGAEGDAIYVDAGAVFNLSDSLALSAGDGSGDAALDNLGITTIRDSHLISSRAGSSNDGIRNRGGGELEIVDSTVKTSGDNGIENEAGTVIVRDSVIEASGPAADGIVNAGGSELAVIGSTVTSASFDGVQNYGTAMVENSHIEATNTSTVADGILNAAAATLEMTGSTVASAGGYAIRNQGTAAVRSTLADTTNTNLAVHGVLNESTGDLEITRSSVNAAGGYGIHNAGGTLIARESQIATARLDGLVNGGGSELTLIASTVTAPFDGVRNSATATVLNSHIEATSTSASADGIDNSTGATLEVTGSTVLAAGGDGVSLGGPATIRDSRIETSSTDPGADGIETAAAVALDLSRSTVISAGGDGIANLGTATIRESHIGATNTDHRAGGIDNHDGATLDVTGSTVTAERGEGIWNEGDATVHGSRIEALNTVGLYDGIWNREGADLTVRESTARGYYGIRNGSGAAVATTTLTSSDLLGAETALFNSSVTSAANSTFTSALDGIYNTGTLDIMGSSVQAPRDGLLNPTGTATVATTAIDASDEVSNTGTLTCLAVSYVNAGTFNATTCP